MPSYNKEDFETKMIRFLVVVVYKKCLKKLWNTIAKFKKRLVIFVDTCSPLEWTRVNEGLRIKARDKTRERRKE